MRTFTIAQIKTHFKGEPYSDCPEFIGQLVQHKILIKVGVNQKAGPFMSDFSSWGPTPSLELKPEIKYIGNIGTEEYKLWQIMTKNTL